ncbi:hypothetical protein COO60DRAFT_56354 [Scenedesmus sp. NREL 46B-D3]|nr:hypothetical protein COO60DRAFT_56354 [Scenedesmus sp. NREL 46B-D3]
MFAGALPPFQLLAFGHGTSRAAAAAARANAAAAAALHGPLYGSGHALGSYDAPFTPQIAGSGGKFCVHPGASSHMQAATRQPSTAGVLNSSMLQSTTSMYVQQQLHPAIVPHQLSGAAQSGAAVALASTTSADAMAEADADARAAAETLATKASSLQAEPARRGLADGDTSVEQVRMI